MLTAKLLPLRPAPDTPHHQFPRRCLAAPHPCAFSLGSPRGTITSKRTCNKTHNHTHVCLLINK